MAMRVTVESLEESGESLAGNVTGQAPPRPEHVGRRQLLSVVAIPRAAASLRALLVTRGAQGWVG